MRHNRLDEEKKAFSVFIKDRKNKKNIIMIMTVVVLIAAASLGKNLLSGTSYLTLDDGSVSGVLRDDADKAASFPLRIDAVVGGEKKRRDVTLIVRPDNEAEGKAGEDGQKDSSAVFDAEVSELLARLSRSGGKKIMLPGELSDGTKLKWHKGQSSTGIMIIFLAPVMVWILYISNEKKKRDAAKERTLCVQKGLPAFNDELLLLLGSGLIFRDAFRRIADGCMKKHDPDFLDGCIIEIEKETERGVSDIVNVMLRKADEVQVTEFSRLAGLIKDNQIRGLDIIGKLRTESEILWDLRKKNAEERGRMAETKLTLPLAILLMVLVLVTAAPAIIQI